MNAYCSVPRQDPDGRFHMVWVWRDTPDCASNHDLSYARSDDLVRWTDSAGSPLALPITVETGEIIDRVPPGGGLLNVNRELGFDNAGRPVVSYPRNEDADPNRYGPGASRDPFCDHLGNARVQPGPAPITAVARTVDAARHPDGEGAV
jgi:hypothetical protein